MKKGLIQIYTGKDKGKITSAVGQAVRALGHSFKVGIVFFHKNFERLGYGEVSILEDLGAEVKKFAEEHPYFSENISEDEIREDA